LFGECIEAGCKTIFLEKPGAPTVSFDHATYLMTSSFLILTCIISQVAELQKMKDDAEAAGVGVLMGYNKVSVATIGSVCECNNANRNIFI
jgi:hypothetical protein